MFKEALYQKASDGRPFVDCLAAAGVLPGVKVDEGLVPLDGTDSTLGETSTRGLDGLAAACAEYRRAGACYRAFCIDACIDMLA